MSGLDELLKGFQTFKQGVTELQTSRAIQGANEQVNQIRMTEADEAEKLNQVRQVANNLAVNLFQQGVPATTVEGISNSMTGGQNKAQPVQSAFQGLVAGLNPNSPEDAKKIREISTSYIKEGAEQKALLEQIRGGAKIDKERRSTLTDFQKGYRGLSGKINESTKYARQALTALKSGNPAAIKAITTMLSKASGEVGNLTEMERAAFEGAQDVLSKVDRYVSRALYSQLTKDDLRDLTDLTNLYIESAEASKRRGAEMITNQALGNDLLADADPNDLISRISGKEFLELSPKQQVPQQDAPSGTPGASQPQAMDWKQFTVPKK